MLHAVGGRKPLALLGGGGALVVVMVALSRRSSSAGGKGATTAANPTGTYDSSLSDFEGYFQDQLDNLQQRIAGQNPTPTTGSGSSAPRPVIHGGTPPRKVNVPVTAPFPPAPKPAARHTQAIVRVQAGNTLSGIAARYGETWQQVYAYNLTPGVRSAADRAAIRRRGANLIFPNEQIYIPSR